MPEEPVKTESGAAEAFLIEARSIGGLSGSPVFVSPGGGYVHSFKITDPYTLGRWGGSGRHYWLLGLVHGHWDVDASDIDMVMPDKVNAGQINTGIGVVIPAQKNISSVESTETSENEERKRR